MYRCVVASVDTDFERSFFLGGLFLEAVHVFDGAGDSGGAVFKNYEHRTIQVSGPSSSSSVTDTTAAVTNGSVHRSRWSAGEPRACAGPASSESPSRTHEISI